MKHKIIAIGDSLTFGYPFGKARSWVGILQKEHNINIINKGINGALTLGMIQRFEIDVINENPTHVVITGGANDAYDFLPYGDILYNYCEMIDMAVTNDIVPIIGITPPVDEEFVERKLTKFRFKLKDYCYNKNIEIIDFYDEMVDQETGAMKEIYDFDGSHPSPKGYEVMAEVALNVIQKILN